jgi:hypothetical protein
MEIKLTRGKVAVVDRDDYKRLSKYRWHYMAIGYAATDIDYKKIYMHRMIMDTPKNMDTDHINSDKLDNRKVNLRVCSHAKNMQNTKKRCDNKSGYKGVTWFARDKKWRARIVLNGIYKHLGYFDTPQEASAVYQKFTTGYNQ